MAHCFQVERVLDAVAEPVAVRDCISGEECYGAVRILEERSNPFQSSAVENLTSLLLQWQISGQYASDSFDIKVGSKLMELLQLYNVAAWRSAIATQCNRAADWCLVSPDWNIALNQAKRIKWCINKLHAVWAAPIRSSVCAQLSFRSHTLSMYAVDIVRMISLDEQGRTTRMPQVAHRLHNLLRDETTAVLSMSSLLNATINQGTHLVRRVWRKMFVKAECSQQAAECFWATRAIIQQALSTHTGRLALSDRAQASVRMWWCILDQHPMWTIAAKAAAMQSTELQDWLNDNLAELHQSTTICEHQDCLLPAQSPVQPSHQCNTKTVTSSCTLQHALAQWPLWNNGELTTELLEDVQRYREFDAITEQARTQLELNADEDTRMFKTQEMCCTCTNQVTLHNEGNELSTDQCSDCWAGADLWRQLVVYVMRKGSNQPVEEPNWKHSGAADMTCLCCSITFEPAQCSSYPLHSTVYCTNCWRQHTTECRSIKQSITTLQRWWRGITHSVYHMAPAPTPDKAKRKLQALPSGSTSPTSYSPLTPQYYSQLSIEASPIKAHQVDWSKSAHGRYQQARAQSVHRAQPEDQEEWWQRQQHRFPRRQLRRSDRSMHSPDRWHPNNSGGSMDTSMSSSVSEAELQLALQDSGPAEVQARAADRQRAPTFAELQPHSGRSVMPVHLLPEEMKLKTSSEVKIEASTRTKQSKIRFKQQINLDRLKTLAITHTEKTNHSNSAPPEEDEQMQPSDLQQAITMSLDHFSKHTIEFQDIEHQPGPASNTCSLNKLDYGVIRLIMQYLPRKSWQTILPTVCADTRYADTEGREMTEEKAKETIVRTKGWNTEAATTQRCSTCKCSKTPDKFEGSFKTCNKCLAAKRKRRRISKAAREEPDSKEGKKLCSSKTWCPIVNFTGGKKTCDNCIKAARARTKARKEVQYSVPAYAMNTTSTPDFQ